MLNKITDMETAKTSAKQGAIACMIIVIITSISAIVSTNYGAFLDVAVFLIIAFGIYKMSRIAAVLGLIVYEIEQILMMQDGSRFSFLAIVFTIGFINAIRGTFAYHKYKREQIA